MPIAFCTLLIEMDVLSRTTLTTCIALNAFFTLRSIRAQITRNNLLSKKPTSMQITGVKNTIKMTLSPTIVQSTSPKPNIAIAAPTMPPSNVCEVLLGTDKSTHITDHPSAAIIAESKNMNPALGSMPSNASDLTRLPTVRATLSLPSK